MLNKSSVLSNRKLRSGELYCMHCAYREIGSMDQLCLWSTRQYNVTCVRSMKVTIAVLGHIQSVIYYSCVIVSYSGICTGVTQQPYIVFHFTMFV